MKKIMFAAFLLFVSPFAMSVETTIKGARMELLNKGENLLFSGGVTLERGDDILTAEEMESTSKRDKVKARGNVEFLRHMSGTEKLKGYGKTGTYDNKSGEGTLVGEAGKAHVIYYDVLSSTLTRKMDIYATRFDFSQSRSSSAATGMVYGITVDPETDDTYEFWAERADYLGQEKKLVLSGMPPPRIQQVNGEKRSDVRGNIIIYYMDSKRMISEGDAQAVFVDPQKQESNP
jgi:lipopolysaccharide export system protein LptA